MTKITNNIANDDKLSVKAHYDNTTKLAVASTDVTDRHGEKISQEGWDLKNFKNNPVMLWAHDHTEISVGNARNIHIERSSGTPRLVFTPDFHTHTPKAKALKALYDEGRLNSFSVGFLPKDFDGKESKYLKQELLEISAVNVPANPDARMMSYKSLIKKGFESDVAKDVTGIEDAEIEATEEANDVEDVQVTEEAVKTLTEVFKGAIEDRVQQEEIQEEKYELMKPIYTMFWSFCDIFYEEETPLEDFNKLLSEFVALISKEVEMPEDEQESKVIDNNPDVDNDKNKSENNNSEVKTQDNKDTSVAPKTLSKEERAKQSLHKVIASASDKVLENAKSDEAYNKNNVVDYAKVIKRATEILIKAQKKG